MRRNIRQAKLSAAIIALIMPALSACGSSADIAQAEQQVRAARDELARAQAAADQPQIAGVGEAGNVDPEARVDEARARLNAAKRQLTYLRMNTKGERGGNW